MSPRHFLIRIVPAVSILLFTFSLPIQARNEIDSPDKLAYLNTATGNTSIQDPYQRRVDAIMDIDPADSNRTYVSDQDAENRIEAKAEAEAEEAARLELVAAPIPKLKNQGPKVETIIEPDPASQGPDKNRQDGRNSTFELMTDKIYEDAEKKKNQTSTLTAGNETAGSQKTGSADTLAPSLSNNPFYFGQAAPEGEAHNFEMDKNIIATRLIQQGRNVDEVNELLRGASGREELIITLMNAIGYTYSQAKDTVEVSREDSSS